MSCTIFSWFDVCIYLWSRRIGLSFVGLASSPWIHSFSSPRIWREDILYNDMLKMIHCLHSCNIAAQKGGSTPYRWKLGHVKLCFLLNWCSNTSGAPKMAALNLCTWLLGDHEMWCNDICKSGRSMNARYVSFWIQPWFSACLKDFGFAIYVFISNYLIIQMRMISFFFILKKDFPTDEKSAANLYKYPFSFLYVDVYAASHDSQPKVPKRF